MKLFLSAIALVLILEGIPYFAAPETVRRVLAHLVTRPAGVLRIFGLSMIVVGLGVLALIRAAAG
ncbi:MAG: DUF2065 domain-containing protein [Acidobacteriota bacterium]|nr:DUF2065 domain-containing protein [Acidobacteriota bacterium]